MFSLPFFPVKSTLTEKSYSCTHIYDLSVMLANSVVFCDAKNCTACRNSLVRYFTYCIVVCTEVYSLIYVGRIMHSMYSPRHAVHTTTPHFSFFTAHI